MVSKRTSKKAPDVENKQLRDYELVLIISPEVVEEKFDATMNTVSQFIADKGGTVSDIEQWGKKRLAYPIKHFTEGNYVLTRCKMPPVLGSELEANLRISEEILRHLLVRVGD